MDRAKLKISEESSGKAHVCRMGHWWKSNRKEDNDDSGPNRIDDKVSSECTVSVCWHEKEEYGEKLTHLIALDIFSGFLVAPS